MALKNVGWTIPRSFAILFEHMNEYNHPIKRSDDPNKIVINLLLIN